MRSVWFTPRAVGLHVLVVVLTPIFVLLFFWQVRRATAGNTLSWAYVFEWPFFLGYLLYMWWRLVHEPAAEADGPPGRTPTPAPARRDGPGAGDPGPGEGADEELAAYNRYLAELNATGRPKRW